ncbi:MAG: DNA/RNA nuclease SfsA [Pseudomonadota bacterium]
MRFQTPLVSGRLLRRYKRFLADVRLESGSEVTAHCPNPGAMTGLAEPGMRVWLEPNDNPARKLKYAWRLVELPGGDWAGIDTAVPNRVVREALEAGGIPELAGYGTVRAEVPYGNRSRVDFHLSGGVGPACWLEVKNVHLRREDDWAEFPDCVTARGAKHLGELAAQVAAGERAVMLYVVQHTGCGRMRLAEDIDSAYAEAARKAVSAGVEMLCYAANVTTNGICLVHALPIDTAA